MSLEQVQQHFFNVIQKFPKDLNHLQKGVPFCLETAILAS